MTLFTELDRDWQSVGRERPTRQHWDEWCSERPDLARWAGPSDLAAGLRTMADRDTKDEMLGWLVGRAPVDCLAGRTVLHSVLFGLIPIAASVRRAVGSPDDAASIVVSTAWDKIRNYPLDRRPRHVATNIVLDTRQCVSRSLFRRRVEEYPTAEIAGLTSVAPDTRPAAYELVALVDDAVRRDRLRVDDARLILLTRIADVPVEDLAAEAGIGVHSLRRRRLRAEAALARSVA